MNKLLGVLLAGLCATGAMAQASHDTHHGPASQDARPTASQPGDHDRQMAPGGREDRHAAWGDRDDRKVAERDRDERHAAWRDHDREARRLWARDDFRHAGWPGHDNGNHYGWYRHGHDMRFDRDGNRHARFDHDRYEYRRFQHVSRWEMQHRRWAHEASRHHEEHLASR